MGDEESSFGIREALDIAHREAQGNMSLIVKLAVLEKVSDLLDVNSRTWHLPQSSMRWLTASTRLALVASLLEELASQACPQFPDFTGLFPLIWPQRSLSSADTLLCIWFRSRRLLLDDFVRRFGNGTLS